MTQDTMIGLHSGKMISPEDLAFARAVDDGSLVEVPRQVEHIGADEEGCERYAEGCVEDDQCPVGVVEARSPASSRTSGMTATVGLSIRPPSTMPTKKAYRKLRSGEAIRGPGADQYRADCRSNRDDHACRDIVAHALVPGADM